MSRKILIIVVTLFFVTSVCAYAAASFKGEVLLGNDVVINLSRIVKGKDLKKVSQKAVDQLNKYIATSKKHDDFRIVSKKVKNSFVVTADKFVIVSIDSKAAFKNEKTYPQYLALNWADNIRKAVKKAKADNKIMNLKATCR